MREILPYVVQLQSDLLGVLPTRVIAPLARKAPVRKDLPARLSPLFEVSGERLMLVPQEAAPIDARALGRRVGSLRGEAHLIIDALDAVISGV
jgi:toxin CcdB